VKVALITGIAGQDGAYLAEMLLAAGYRVVGTHPDARAPDKWRLEELGIASHPELRLAGLDLGDLEACVRLVAESGATEVYSLAGKSFLGASSADPAQTTRITGLGPVNLLEAVRCAGAGVRFFQASSSEMFGIPEAAPQDEETRFQPCSPYAAAKVLAHGMVAEYRARHGVFATSGILYNHESPLRARDFVTRKIADGFARIRLGMLDYLELGSMDAKRDWGYAKDFMRCAWSMLRAPVPADYVVATGRATTVRRFVELAGRAAGFELEWHGRGLEETGVDGHSGRTLVKINPKFFRPADDRLSVGNAAKAERELGWRPVTPLEEICRMMVEGDLRRLQRPHAG